MILLSFAIGLLALNEIATGLLRSEFSDEMKEILKVTYIPFIIAILSSIIFNSLPK
jgi:hypothetical protein